MKSAEAGSQASLAGRRLSIQESSGQHVSLPQGPGVFDRIGEKPLAPITLQHCFKPAAEARTIRSMDPSESSGDQMMPAETGSQASLAGSRFGCQESSRQHASRAQGADVVDRIGEKPLDLQEIRSPDTAPQEIPARVLLEVPRYRIEQDSDPYSLTDPYNSNDLEEEELVAAKLRQLENDKVRVSFDMSLLESLYSTSIRTEYLRASKTSNGEILLTLSDDEDPTKACPASEAECNQLARTALKNELAREYLDGVNIANSDWVHETGPLTVDEADWIGRRVKAAYGWGRQETPERVFLDHLADCLRLGGPHSPCIELVRLFNRVRDNRVRELGPITTDQILIREALTGRPAEQPWMVELHREAREIYDDLPDLGLDADSVEEAEQLVAWMSRDAAADKFTMAFDERVLEFPTEPEQFLRLYKSETGEFSPLLAEDDGGDKVCMATEGIQDLATRFAFSYVLERRYPGVLASVQSYRDFMRLPFPLTLGEAGKIWNAVKVQHEVELCNGGKSFKDKLVRENDFLWASNSLPRTVRPLDSIPLS